MVQEAAYGKRFLSFVVPIHNEEESLVELHRSIRDMCMTNGYEYEVIFVDDGSTDSSFTVIENIAKTDLNVRAIQFRRNFGQTAALSAGIAHSRSPLIVTLDADLQNDPADVPAMLRKMDEGYDIVSGWRKLRMDNWLRRMPSRLANRLIAKVTGIQLSDFGCTLKIYKREYLEQVPLYGEMHRFMPVYAAWHGAKVTEISVHHHPRKHGSSHYGLNRTVRVLLDLLTVKFLHSYISRPMYFFGGCGIWFIVGSILTGLAAMILKVTEIRTFVNTPLPLMSMFLLTNGILFMLMGLLAELLIRIYFEQGGRKSYFVHRTIGVDLPKHIS